MTSGDFTPAQLRRLSSGPPPRPWRFVWLVVAAILAGGLAALFLKGNP